MTGFPTEIRAEMSMCRASESDEKADYSSTSFSGPAEGAQNGHL